MSNIFAIATRKKLRFPVAGSLSVEDVWDLPLKARREGQLNLDGLAFALNEVVEKQPRKSFVDDAPTTADNSDDALRLAIVLEIISVKKAELAAKENEAVRAGRANQLDELIARKQNQELEGKSLEELQAMRNAL